MVKKKEIPQPSIMALANGRPEGPDSKEASNKESMKDKIQYVNKSTKSDLAITSILVALLSLLGNTFLAAIILRSFPILGFYGFVAIALSFTVLFTVLSISRNHVIGWIFGRISHQSYLTFAIFWKRFPLLVVVFSILLGFSTSGDTLFVVYAFTFIFLTMPLYFIFEKPLSYEGGIELLFDGLHTSIEKFNERQYYLKPISKEIERMLESGNIEVRSGDFVYQINRRLSETDVDLSNDLLNIKSWLLGKRRILLDSLWSAVPDLEISASTKEPFLKRVIENPTPIQADLIKFFAIIVAAVTVLLIRPEMLTSVISLVKGILGM